MEMSITDSHAAMLAILVCLILIPAFTRFPYQKIRITALGLLRYLALLAFAVIAAAPLVQVHVAAFYTVALAIAFAAAWEFRPVPVQTLMLQALLLDLMGVVEGPPRPRFWRRRRVRMTVLVILIPTALALVAALIAAHWCVGGPPCFDRWQ